MLLLEKTNNYFKKFSRVALAVSGGRDSMALLSLFMNNKESLCDFIVVNVHHNLRGEEGKRDSLFVKDFCLANGIKIVQFDEDIPAFCNENGYTIEQGARIMRRKIFAQLVDSGQVDRVVTAHHGNDQTESILMHICRGSGVNGLKGMNFDDGLIVRPLLDSNAQEIQEYANSVKLNYVVDSTNSDNRFSRNNIRNKVLPVLEQTYPRASENINKLAVIAREMTQLIDEACPPVVLENGNAIISIDNLSGNGLVVAELIARAMDAVGTRVDLSSQHINAIKGLAVAEGGKRLNLPHKIIATRVNNTIVFSLNVPTSKFNIIKQQPISLGQFDCGEYFVVIDNKDNGGLRCDKDKIAGGVLRNKQNGDKIHKFGGGTKSLGDFLTDKKISLEERNKLVVIAKEKQVLAIPTIDISCDIAVDETTQEVWYIQVAPKEIDNGKNC